jgi:hypothetical protein
MAKSSLQYPTLVTWTDPQGKTHIPPDPPLVDGCPPWLPRPNEYKRETPLTRCPSLACRRSHVCASLLYGAYCQKTHMDRETFRGKIIEHIDAITRSCGREPAEYTGGPVPTPPPEMKRALQQRQDFLFHEALLKWQTDWIQLQKNKQQKRAKKQFVALE